MPDRAEFEALRLELLRGGIANLYVERTLRELADHYDDLERASLAAGCSREEAAQRARSLLGRPEPHNGAAHSGRRWRSRGLPPMTEGSARICALSPSKGAR